jgi:hypothetical protein
MNNTPAYPGPHCGQQNPNSLLKCILNQTHTGPHTDGEQQWSDSLDSNYDIAAREASKPTPVPAWASAAFDADQIAMHNSFMEKCKPFLPGVKVFTAFGEGEIVKVLNVNDQYRPFEVKCTDGQTRMFKRNGLSLNPANAPKLTCTCDSNPHAFDCPLALPSKPQSMLGASHTSIAFDGYISFTIADDVFWACPECGAITKQPALHSKWHKER